MAVVHNVSVYVSCKARQRGQPAGVLVTHLLTFWAGYESGRFAGFVLYLSNRFPPELFSLSLSSFHVLLR